MHHPSMVFQGPVPRIKAAACVILAMHFCVSVLAGVAAPTITSQPQPQSAFIGASLNLRVAAIPSAALRYRWRFNGTNLPASFPGQFTSLLMITNAAPSDAGPYSVVVSNSFGAVTSDTAVVSINNVNLGTAGYVNLFASPGLSLFGEPLGRTYTNQTVDNQFPFVQDGVSIFKIDGTGFIANNYLDGWSSPDMILTLGEGWFFANATTNQLVLTVVGSLSDGSLTNRLPAGVSLCASLLPQAGPVTSLLGLPATAGLELFQFDRSSQSFQVYTVPDYDWYPIEPSVAVGESFFVREPTQQDWIRNIAINGGPLPPYGIRLVEPAITSETAEINFFTYNQNSNFGRTLDLDGVTPVTNNFVGQLYAATANFERALAPIGRPTAFLNGAGAGYIRSATLKLPGVTGGQTVYAQLRVWEKCAGDSYEAAVNNGGATGRSAVFSAAARATLENGLPSLPPPSANNFPSFQVSLGPEVPLRVASIQATGSTVEICFATRPDSNYCLQSAPVAGPSPSMNWTTMPGHTLIPGTGHVVSVTDNSAGQQKFYRVCRVQ